MVDFVYFWLFLEDNSSINEGPLWINKYKNNIIYTPDLICWMVEAAHRIYLAYLALMNDWMLYERFWRHKSVRSHCKQINLARATWFIKHKVGLQMLFLYIFHVGSADPIWHNMTQKWLQSKLKEKAETPWQETERAGSLLMSIL